MKKVSNMAHKYRNNRLRIRKIDDILRRAMVRKPKFNGEHESSDDNVSVHRSDSESSGCESDDSKTSRKENDSDIEHKEDDEMLQSAEIEVPEELKDVLTEDCNCIIGHKQLVKLPAVPNIVTVLEQYVASFINKNPEPKPEYADSTTPVKSVQVCKEMADGLRISFDFLLPLILLYDDERRQYEELKSTFIYQHPSLQCQPTMQSHPPIIKKEQESVVYEDQPVFGERVRRVSERLHHTSPPVLNEAMPTRVQRRNGVKKEPKNDDQYIPRRITRHSITEYTPVFEESDGASLKKDAIVKKRRRNWSHKKVYKTQLSTKSGNMTSNQRTDTAAGRVRYGSLDRKVVYKSGNVWSMKNTKVLRRLGISKTNDAAINSALPTLDADLEDKLPLKRSTRLRKLSGYETPPPPLLIPSSISANSAKDSDETISLKNRATESTWSLLPQEILEKRPALPSVMYGPHHLLRLFVKMPDVISKMRMQPSKLTTLLTHFDLFLQYLVTEKDRLFPPCSYLPR